MKDDASLMTLYRTTIDGDWKQTVCKAKLVSGALAGDEPARVARLVQKQLGISYDAARHLVASMFTRKSGLS